MAVIRPALTLLAITSLAIVGCGSSASQAADTAVPPPPKTAAQNGLAPSPDVKGSNPTEMPGDGPAKK